MSRESSTAISTLSSPTENHEPEENKSIDQCVEDMVAERNKLRERFKNWADEMDYSAKRIRCITDNALVNQSNRLENILEAGKARVESIVNDQNKLKEQLNSFVSILTSAQSQIFGSIVMIEPETAESNDSDIITSSSSSHMH